MPKLQLIRAAGGDGKSTILLQIAAEAARSSDWDVLWRPRQELGLLPEALAALDPDRQWLIVADDAETLGQDVWESAIRLNNSGRSNFTFLLATRDADWRARELDLKAWEKRLNQLPDVELGALSLPDAEKIVDAWAAQGKDGCAGWRGSTAARPRPKTWPSPPRKRSRRRRGIRFSAPCSR